MRWHDIFGRGVALNHTEQPMDLTLLSGILASRQFPPQDPWFAPYPINYYYLGYLLVAALIRLSGVAVGQRFHAWHRDDLGLCRDGNGRPDL